MRVIIHQHRVELTPALTKYIQEKISKLEELLQKSQREHLASVHIGEVGRDQGQSLFGVGVAIMFRGKKIFTEEKGHDLYTVIDVVQAELRRQLTKQKERPFSLLKRGALKAKQNLRQDQPTNNDWVNN
jgi:ribosomal subunit interface protein